MKFNFIKTTLIATLALTTFFSSCKKDDDKPVVVPPVVVVPDTAIVLTGNLTTQTLDASKKYLIKGTAIIGDGIILTVPAGTVVKGEKKSKGTLLITKGGQLIANGTEEKPVVFTSNQDAGERDKGDWGGIVMLGKANCNQNNPAIEGISPTANFGTFQSTANDNDKSGELRYVRIEYAGIALTPNNETNSLTMGACGTGTVIENVQVTYGGDDGFEWFGGTVNCKNLISYATWDDDFDCDFGFIGKVQYALAVRDPFAADQSGSNGFEVDNDGSGTTATPKTAAVFSNVTVLGASFDSSKAVSGNYQHAMHLRRNCELSIFNSVFSGFPLGLNLDGTLSNYTSGLGVLDHNILVATGNNKRASRPFLAGSADALSTVGNYWTTTKMNQVFTSNTLVGSPKYSKAYDDAGIPTGLILGFSSTAGPQGNYPKDPNFATFTGVTQTGGTFTDAKVSTWFTSTTFKGAFGSTDWTNKWADFNPQNNAY